MKKKLLILLPVTVAGILLFSFAPKPDDYRTNYASTITAADLKRHLSILASDEYEGRETTKKGQKMSAEYIAQQFKSFGIPELPGGGYYQDVPLIQYEPGTGTISAANEPYAFGKDFYYTSGIEDCSIKSEACVLAGYGINDPKWNDYDGLDVKGKTVLIFAGDPTDKNGISLISGKKDPSAWATQRRLKTNEANKKGAAALFIIVNDFSKALAENQHSIQTPTLKLDEEVMISTVKPMPVLYISKSMADRLLKSGKQKATAEKFSAKMKKKKRSANLSFSLPVSIEIKRKAISVHSENVLGYIEGSELKDELIVITAHYDHLGKDSAVVFNGADDDGSGTVAVLELAEAFAKAKHEGRGPRRSILFMTVTGEEKGLLGSRWYTSHPVFSMKNTVCDLNIDMIGRLDPEHETAKDTNYVYVIGSDKLSSELKQINEQMNARYTGLNLDYRYDVENEPNMYYYRSDHYNFAKNDIPVAFYFNGTHADYHKETDEVSKIDFAIMERRSRLVFFVAWEIANREKRIVVDKKKK